MFNLINIANAVQNSKEKGGATAFVNAKDLANETGEKPTAEQIADYIGENSDSQLWDYSVNHNRFNAWGWSEKTSDIIWGIQVNY